MNDRDLNALIDKALSGKEPDPHVIARRLVARIDDEMRRELVIFGLLERVKHRVRVQRPDFIPGQMSGESQAPCAGDKPAASSRWARHSRYLTPDGWKLYDNLSAEDCDFIAESYEQRAASNAELAKRFRETARLIRSAGAVRVADVADLPVAA